MTAFGGPRLPPAAASYNQRAEQELRNEIERRDDENYKRRRHIDLDPSTYIIMTSPDGTRYSITVENGGTLAVTEL